MEYSGDAFHTFMDLDSAIYLAVNETVTSSDGKFGSFYWLGPLSLVQQNEQIFFRVISFILAKYN